VNASGGKPVPITSLGPGELGHGFPTFLPDNMHFLYLATKSSSNELRVGSLASRDYRSLGPFTTKAQYAAGYLFTVLDDRLTAQRFDTTTYQLTGSPTQLAVGVGVVLGQAARFSVSDSGSLVYAPREPQKLTWFDRDGKVLSTVADPGWYSNLDLSPDEQRIAVARNRPVRGARTENDLWLIDLARSGAATRLTDDLGFESDPSWSPEGRRLAFTHSAIEPPRHFGLFVRPAEPSGQNQSWLNSGNISTPHWSHNGKFILYTEDSAGQADLWTIPTSDDRQPSAFLKTQYEEKAGVFSPNDRWIAYGSNRTGRSEVYARPFPVSPGEFQVSRDGGHSARWRGDGKEIFFLALDGWMMAANVDASHEFVAGPPTKLFRTHFRQGDNRQYDVTKDGQRFIMPIPLPPEPITVLLNWPALLHK
jgi:dipeptidyl aminopeptidase/acylaminoacyl peptidase